MQTTSKLSRALALIALAIGAMSTVAAVSIPAPHTPTSPLLGAAWLALVSVHAALYWWGDTIRRRFRVSAYLLTQAMVVFAIGATGALYPLAAALYIGLVVEAHSLIGQRIGMTPIALIAVVLFSIDAIIEQGVYVGASRGVALVVIIVILHAVTRLVARRPSLAKQRVAAESEHSERDYQLTAREIEVLRAISRGARSTVIATDLGITERTVKAHLANIYLKLGVESRTAAVAEAMRRGLT